jgi:hypothetical protein
MLARIGAAGTLLACLMVGPALAEVRTDVRYTSYPVRGLTIADIWRDIARKGPHQPERGLSGAGAMQRPTGEDASSIVPSESFRQKFDHTAQCVDDPNAMVYPPMEEITERFFAGHRRAIDALERANDAQFVVPNPNEAMRAKFATAGSMFGFYLGGHVMMHMGQLSAWRRMMGLGRA